MKAAPFAAALTAIVAASSIASPTLAQGYGYYPSPIEYDSQTCQATKHQAQTGGGILGALAGAVIGSNLGQGGGRTGAAVLGAVAGAVVGSNIAINASRDSGVCQAAENNFGYQQARYDRWRGRDEYQSASYHRWYAQDRGGYRPAAYDPWRDREYGRYMPAAYDRNQ